MGGETEGRNIIDASRCYLVQGCQVTDFDRRGSIHGDIRDAVELHTFGTLSQ